MIAQESVFFDVNLPNATTWFYFSWLLAVALFFKFSRLLSVRNFDVLSLFLLVPGLLLLVESHGTSWYGYLWLLGGSGYFLIRCLVDLALVRRPALGCNLNFSGLAWLALALFVCLITVAVRPRDDHPEMKVGKAFPATLDEFQRQGEHLVQNQAAGDADGYEIRFWVERTLALSCHLAIVAGLVFIGWRHFQDLHAGMAAATFYLILPYTALHMGQWHHVWPMALIVWAIAAYRKPLLAGFLLGLAAGTVYFPLLALPVWLSFYWRRGAGRFAVAFGCTAGLCIAAIGVLLWINGELPHSLRSAMSLSGWQPWKEPNTEGFWKGIHWAYRMPVFLGYVVFFLATAFWPAPKNLAHLLALSAALIIGLQFWYADQGGVYVLWYLPLLLLMVFRPNLADRRPLPIDAETDWLHRLGRALARVVVRLVSPPEQVARVR